MLLHQAPDASPNGSWTHSSRRRRTHALSVAAAHALLLWMLAGSGSWQPLRVPTPVTVALLAEPGEAQTPPPQPRLSAPALRLRSAAPPAMEPPAQPRPAEPTPSDRGTATPPPEPAPPPQAQVIELTTPLPPALPPKPASVRQRAITEVEYVVPPAPVYPLAARRLREQGSVQVRVQVDEQGRPERLVLERSSGSERLDEAALAAVRAARFKPYTEDGIARPFWVLVPLIFELER